MRGLFAIVASVFFVLNSFSQTFSGTGGAIPGTSTSQTCFSRTVTGVGMINATNNGLSSVCINLTHPNDDELEVVLTAPDGTVVPLTLQNGGTGNNYTNTCFSATATNPVKFGTAPFTGSFLPEGYLGAVNNGQNADGVWRLCIQDRRTAGNAGTLNSWSLTFSNTPAPAPPVMPACANTLPSTSSCSTAALVCDFNGQCGTTNGTSVQDWTGSGLDGCFGLQNNSFIRFIASASTASFSVWVPASAIGTYNQGGIQMLFFSGTCNSGPVTTYGCYPHILPYSGTGQPLVTVVTAAGLMPGNTYYLMIDGFNNDNCNFTIAANTGVNILNVSPAAPAICAGSSVNLTASGGNGVYAWSPATNLNTTSGATVIANPAGTTTYTVTSTTVTGCPITKDVTVAVNALPATPVGSVSQQPSCGDPFGRFVFNTPIGSQFEYSVNGINYQASTVFGFLSPGNYNATVRDINTGCVSAAFPFVVNAAPALPPVPIVSITQQPNCAALNTATLQVTSPVGANYEYSFDGINFQSSPVLTGVPVPGGNVTIWVRDIVSGCSRSVGVVTNPPIPMPPISVRSNSCPPVNWAPGTINIDFPFENSGYLFSIDGVNFQASSAFVNLQPGNYTVCIKSIAYGCISPVRNMSIVGLPAPTFTVTHPDCNTPTGTVIITSPLGPDYAYQLLGSSGPWQTSPVFTNVTPGSYGIILGLLNTTCFRPPVGCIVNPSPVPAAPTVIISSAPDCHVATGTITVTAPLGANLEYSLNGINYQSQTSFLAVPPGTYNILVRNAGSGCSSATTSITLNAAAPAPPAPVASVTSQPGCTVSTGTVVFSSPLGTQYEYSLDGINFQSSPLFSAVVAGNHIAQVRNTGSTCISSGTSLSLGVPAVIASYFIQSPQCAIQSGSISFSNPLGSMYEYSIDGINFQTFPFFGNLAPGNYSLVARNTNTGCISAAYPATIHPPNPSPPSPLAIAQHPGCNETTGSITITSPLGAGYVYSLSPVPPFQASTTFNNLAPGTYYVYSGSMTTGCVNVTAPLKVIINRSPAPPTTASVNVIQPSCVLSTGTIIITSPAGADLEYSTNGTSYQSSSTFVNLQPGNYNVTVRNTTSGCVSNATNAVLKSLLPQDCITGSDIYFPSAFTANGDGMNDGFGPGPGSNLGGVSQYNLSVYNRYGELVFKTSDPYNQWTGRYKGKLLANYSYSWTATYRFRNGPQQRKTGTVILIR